ncbi:hypothetical protein [Microbulbifer sp. HZ11]|uniref:hypothetical protein n=1 Tax=Microbulbifer sp. HZ11 TaxID=1453501 RepID=UPI0012DF276C|nr:hypothetical protein [Microbulbifer sp. HZ11]
METEEISKVEIVESGEMYVILKNGGKPMYQYIYREAEEVCWVEGMKGFKSPQPRKWSYSDWYEYIVSVAASGLGISLYLTNNTIWQNVPENSKSEIRAKFHT